MSLCMSMVSKCYCTDKYTWLKLTLLDWSACLWLSRDCFAGPSFKTSDSPWRCPLWADYSLSVACVVHGAAANVYANIVQTVCHRRWAHSQMKWRAKMTQYVWLASKNIWRLTSKSTDSSLTWIHSDRDGAHKCKRHSGPLTHLWAHYGNTIIIQSVLLSPTLHGSDLSHCSLAEAPLTLRTRERPYALCLHATYSPQPHETCCHHAFMSPGWIQHHTQRLCQLAVCATALVCSHHSVFQGPRTRYTVDVWQVWAKWRKHSVCLQVSLIRQSRPRNCPIPLRTLKTG